MYQRRRSRPCGTKVCQFDVRLAKVFEELLLVMSVLLNDRQALRVVSNNLQSVQQDSSAREVLCAHVHAKDILIAQVRTDGLATVCCLESDQLKETSRQSEIPRLMY